MVSLLSAPLAAPQEAPAAAGQPATRRPRQAVLRHRWCLRAVPARKKRQSTTAGQRVSGAECKRSLMSPGCGRCAGGCRLNLAGSGRTTL